MIIDTFDWTPLHYSVANGHYEISKLIIDEIDINNLKTPCGWTLLHIASKVEICQLILDRVTGDLFLILPKKMILYLLHCNNEEKSSLRSNLLFKVNFEVLFMDHFEEEPCPKVPNKGVILMILFYVKLCYSQIPKHPVIMYFRNYMITGCLGIWFSTNFS